MRSLVPLAMVLLLSSCGTGDDFNQRYRDRSEAVEQSAANMEREMSRQLLEGEEADTALGVDPALYPSRAGESER